MSLADELDELDPDFNHAFPDNDELDSLGSHFGNPINQQPDSDDDDEDPAYQASLRALHSQFKVGDGMGASLADLSSSSAESDLGSHWGKPVASTSSASAPMTPQRSGGAHRREGSRNSLAFELASASKPSKGTNRDLLRELGIDEADEQLAEESGEYSREYSSEDEDQFAHFGSRVRSPSHAGPGSSSPRTATALAHQMSRISLGGHSSPPGTPSMRRKLSHKPSDEFGGAQLDEQEEERRVRETERVQRETKHQMDGSLTLTTAFLRRLKSHTTPVDPSSGTSRLTSAVGSPTLAPIASTSASAALSTAVDDAPADRQGVVEQLAGGVVKSLYELVRQREQMNRELVEVERQVMKGGAGWQAALASVDELPPPEPYIEDALFSSIQAEKVHADSEEDELVFERREPNGDGEPPVGASRSPALSSLSHLRSTTASLLSSLSTLHESSQVSLAAASESGRKLRALRGQLQAAQEDWQSSTRAEELLREWEAQAGQEGREKGWRGRTARQVREEVEVRLEEGWRRAREVLVVA